MKRRKCLTVFGLHVRGKQSSSAMLCNTTVSAAARLTMTAVWLSYGKYARLASSGGSSG
jgi:hypothetical protein